MAHGHVDVGGSLLQVAWLAVLVLEEASTVGVQEGTDDLRAADGPGSLQRSCQLLVGWPLSELRPGEST